MKPVIVNLEQRSQGWHDWRNGVDLDGIPRITATAAVTIFGENPYQDAGLLFREMLGLSGKVDLSGNPNVQRGVENEHHALNWAMSHTGRVLADVCVQHGDYPEFAASLDGGDIRGDLIEYAAELKCPAQYAMDALRQQGRKHKSFRMYGHQVQWQMFCSGAPEGGLFFYDCWQPHKSVFLPVRRNNELIGRMEERARLFRLALAEKDFRIFNNGNWRK